MPDLASIEASQAYALEQAIARLDADKDRLDAFMTHTKWLVSAVSSIGRKRMAPASTTASASGRPNPSASEASAKTSA